MNQGKNCYITDAIDEQSELQIVDVLHIEV